MRQPELIGALDTLSSAPPELSYPGLSPQLLARIRLLWSSRGLNFDRVWRGTVRNQAGFRAVPRMPETTTSTEVDLVFLFDQCLIWAKVFNAAIRLGSASQTDGLDPAQWQGLAAVSSRLVEQLGALRLLALTDMPMPAMQIARSVSEDVDMATVLLVRRKLAARFVACSTFEEANEFWRRHISGGRAFRAIAEKLYTVGIDYSSDSEYADWRKRVLSVLGAAVHGSALEGARPAKQNGVLQNEDSVYFTTYRVHELCAYSQLVKPNLTECLEVAAEANRTHPNYELATIAPALCDILVNQMQSLTQHSAPTQSREANMH